MTTDPIIITQIHDQHKQRRFAMKIQQKLDRALESFVRVNATQWHPELDEKERAKINTEVKTIIKAIRDGSEDYPLLTRPVAVSDGARRPADEMREQSEKEMTRLAEQLHVYPWIKNIHGAGTLGLATIVAEANDLNNYANPAKLINRLGFAPYDGLAGSTWKRETWRPRKLTAEEWTEHPFSGERYALMHQIAVWLVMAQIVSKTKTASGKTESKGPYGEIYCRRYYGTADTRPDWSDGHRHMDAIRITMKAFLIDLWAQWTGKSKNKRSGRPSNIRRARAFIKRYENAE